MNQTFINSKNDQEINATILHTFETINEYGRNLVAIEIGNEQKLAYIIDNKLQIIDDSQGLEDIYNKSLDQLVKLKYQGQINEANLEKVEKVFNDLNMPLALDRLSKYRTDLEKEKETINQLSAERDKNNEKLSNEKSTLENLNNLLIGLNKPTIYQMTEQADKIAERKSFINGKISNCMQQIANLESIINAQTRDISARTRNIENKKKNVQQEEKTCESLRQKAISILSKNASQSELNNLEFIFNKKCDNYINGNKKIDTIDSSFKDNLDNISDNILKCQFEINRKNSIIEKIEFDMKRLDEYEQQLIYNFKQEVIAELEKNYSGEDLRKNIENLENYKGKLIRQQDEQNINDMREKYNRLLEQVSQLKNDDKTKLKEEQDKYDRKINSAIDNYMQLTKISEKNQTYLELIQFTSNLMIKREKLSPEDKDILNKYEDLKRKKLAVEYKLEQDKKELKKLGPAKKAMYEKLFYNKHVKAVSEIETELLVITSTNSALLNKSIYSNDLVCDTLLYDKQIRQTTKYIEKYTGYTKKGKIELKKALEQAKKAENNKKQQYYRDIQRQNIEDNDNALLDENVKETSLDRIIRKDKSIITRFKKKTQSTKLYQSIVNSKVVTKLADSEIVFAVKRAFIEQGLKISGFRSGMKDFANKAGYQDENERRR